MRLDGVRFGSLLGLLVVLLLPAGARAHVGSKDVFEELQAGPYRLFVTVRMPVVIPGVALIEVRTRPAAGLGTAAISGIEIAPTLLTGEASKHPPTPDRMQRSTADPNFYSGSVWIMGIGAWQIHFDVDGIAGHQAAGVPIPAMATTTLHMQRGLGVTLGVLGALLVLSMASVIGAATREARLKPGMTPDAARRRRGRYASLGALGVLIGLVALGGTWWNVDAASYARDVFRPLTTTATLSGSTLDLRVSSFEAPIDHRWKSRANNDWLPDHGHLMHLYAIREPGMDAAYHLHPALASPGDFRVSLPAMPAGTYRLYGDVVHANGFPETLISRVTLSPGLSRMVLSPEDAEAHPAPLDAGLLGPEYRLPDGYTMRWERPACIAANAATLFRFTLLDHSGRPAGDMEPYLGMAGHAAFVKTDGTVFAHTHPEGSAAMQSMMLANPGTMRDMLASDAANDSRLTGPVAATVEFPYGFPSGGRYRIFVQMKHGATVETGVFDAESQ